MSRAALITLLAILLIPSARAAEPCGDHLRAFNLYEVMEEGEIKSRHSVFPLPEEWSDASAFHRILSDSGEAMLEVTVEGRKKTFSFRPWDKDPSLFIAEGFLAKKIMQNSEIGGSLILRLKRGGKVTCENRLDISGD